MGGCSKENPGTEIKTSEISSLENMKKSEILSEKIWKTIDRIEYYEGFDIPYMVNEEKALNEICSLMSDLEYQKVNNPMVEGGYFFDIYTEDGNYCSMWIANDVVIYNGIVYKASATMLGDNIRDTIMNNYCRNICVEEYVDNDYRIYILDKNSETDKPINISMRFLTDKEKNILQHTITVDKTLEYGTLNVQMTDETTRTKSVSISADDYKLTFKFDTKDCEVFDIVP